MERALFRCGARHGGRIERHQQIWIAVQDRQRVGHLRIHRQAHRAGVELHRHRRSVDSDGFADAAHLEHGVHGHVAAALHQNILLNELTEPGRFHRDGVVTGLHEIEQILADASRMLDRLHAGFVVTQRHLGADYDGLSGVLYDALHFGSRVLSGNGAASEQRETERPLEETIFR